MAANAKDNIDGTFFVVLPICVLVVDNGKKLCAAMRKTPTNDCIAESCICVANEFEKTSLPKHTHNSENECK